MTPMSLRPSASLTRVGGVLRALYRGCPQVTSSLVVGLVASAGGCGGDPPLTATFTSRVVQLESCRVIGSGEEGCEKDEQFAELRVELVQVDDDSWWLHGVPLGGVEHTSLLGTRDTAGGLLFVVGSEQVNSATGCQLAVRTQLSLRVDPERVDEVGDPCVALVGRQIDETAASAECDDAGSPPQPVRRIVRRRWEPLDDTSRCVSGE
jgi:hypothetical protein